MAIFNSYVKLPEGNLPFHGFQINHINYSRHQMSGLGTRLPSAPWPVQRFQCSFDVALVKPGFGESYSAYILTFEVDHPSMVL